jgi:DNA polymerase-4
MPAAPAPDGVSAIMHVRLHSNLAAADPRLYRQLANLIFEVAEMVELLPPDTVIADLTDAPARPALLAGMINRIARDRYGLHTCVGLGPNRMIAALAAASTRPGTVCRVPAAGAAAFIRIRSVGALPGISPHQARLLHDAGLHQAGDLADPTPAQLQQIQHILGPDGTTRAQHQARGIDPRPITPTPRPQPTAPRGNTRDGWSPVERLWRHLVSPDT